MLEVVIVEVRLYSEFLVSLEQLSRYLEQQNDKGYMFGWNRKDMVMIIVVMDEYICLRQILNIGSKCYLGFCFVSVVYQ